MQHARARDIEQSSDAAPGSEIANATATAPREGLGPTLVSPNATPTRDHDPVPVRELLTARRGHAEP